MIIFKTARTSKYLPIPDRFQKPVRYNKNNNDDKNTNLQTKSMIAKKTNLIISNLQNSSLQSSLQKLQLSYCMTNNFCLQSSLQPQAVLQTVCNTII